MILRHSGPRISTLGQLSGAGDRALFDGLDDYARAEMRGFGAEADLVAARRAQAADVLARLDGEIARFSALVQSPPWGTPESVKGGWRTLLRSIQDARSRAGNMLEGAVQTPEAFKKWLDLVKTAYESTAYGLNLEADVGFTNALAYTYRETVREVTEAAKPFAWGTLAVVGIAVIAFAFAKGGGSIVRTGSGK